MTNNEYDNTIKKLRIKNALRCQAGQSKPSCIFCPYYKENNEQCDTKKIFSDALEYIETIEYWNDLYKQVQIKRIFGAIKD